MIQSSCSEQSIFWTDAATDIRCRIRADAHHENVIIDLKTTTDARPGGFTKQARQNDYDLQAAHYINGIEAMSGIRKPFWFIAVEVNAPHGVWIHEAGATFIDDGNRRIEQAMKSLSSSRLADQWPGYVEPWSELCYSPPGK